MAGRAIESTADRAFFEDLDALAERARELAERHGRQRKFVLLARALRALHGATLNDVSPRALDGIGAWATSAKRKAPRSDVATNQEIARAWTVDVKRLLLAGCDRRNLVIWLTGRLFENFAFVEASLEELSTRVDAALPKRLDDARKIVVAALKTRLRSDDADQLFQAETVKKARAHRRKRKRAL
jgi:hypothetical protein